MKANRKLGLLTQLIILVVIIWALSAIIIIQGLENWPNRGNFGDVFGAVSALFSGLAFAGLIYTIILQKQDMVAQRAEIAANRLELQKSSMAQERSEQALKEQVVQMKLTARLSALNTLIDYYNEQINNPLSKANHVQEATQKKREAIHDIDQLIDQLNTHHP